MSSSQSFKRAQQKERQVIEQLFIKINPTECGVSSPDSCARWDFFFVANGVRFVGEIKCRNVASDEYPDALIEKSKYEALVDKAQKENALPIYVNHYTDGTVCLWRLDRSKCWQDGEPAWRNVPCPKSTCGDRSTVLKPCGFLTISAAVRTTIAL